MALLSRKQVNRLESILTERLQDAIEIGDIWERDGHLVARIVFDGTDNAGHGGTVTFTLHNPGGDVVEDLEFLDITGSKFLHPELARKLCD